DHALWNAVMPDDGILCVHCFVKRAEAQLGPTVWKVSQAGVVQGTERGVPNPVDAGSTPAPGSTPTGETPCACEEYWPGQGHHPECPTVQPTPCGCGTDGTHWLTCPMGGIGASATEP